LITMNKESNGQLR